LLDNAYRATDHPTVQDKRIWLGVRAGNGEIRLQVGDQGIPMPPDAGSWLFQRQKSTWGGFGVGLSGSYRIAVAHGGKLEFQDAPPVKIFTLTLPRLSFVEQHRSQRKPHR